MYVCDFERLLYNMFSEELFKNQIFDMTDENYVYTISDYFSQHFGIIDGETWTCITFHTKKPKVLKDD